MKNINLKYLFVFVVFFASISISSAQQRSNRASRRTTRQRTSSSVQASTPIADNKPVEVTPPPAAPAINYDSLPIKPIKRSLRLDDAVETVTLNGDRTPLAYENLRADDAAYRQKIMRELDCREKMNLPFMYSADDNNGNQRFFSILLQAIQDGAVTPFDDERFTTPMTRSQVTKKLVTESEVVTRDSVTGEINGKKIIMNELALDEVYRYRIKEEVIFDKESSRLFWRILGICPIRNKMLEDGSILTGVDELFWIYYPDLRSTLAKYEVYNPKNFSAKMSWEELFENRFFTARIIKSSMENPRNKLIEEYEDIKNNKLMQLMEGENVKEKISIREQDYWQY